MSGTDRRPGAEMVDGPGPYQVGTRVEVKNRFDRRWSRGFEVAEVLSAGYRVRRLSDGSVIPVVFRRADVRADAPAPARFALRTP